MAYRLFKSLFVIIFASAVVIVLVILSLKPRRFPMGSPA